MASTAVKGLNVIFIIVFVFFLFFVVVLVLLLLFFVLFLLFLFFCFFLHCIYYFCFCFILEKTLPSVEACLIIDRSHQNTGSIWDHSRQWQPVTCGITAGCVCC